MANTELNTTIQLRNDSTANWETYGNGILEKGEVGIEFQENSKVALKIGDGEKSWNELEYFASSVPATVYQVDIDAMKAEDPDAGYELDFEAAIDKVVADSGNELQAGDIAIVKAGIVGDKTSYTSYVWDGKNWVATDGNYSAANVYTNSKIVLAGDYGQDSRKDKITSIGNLRIGDEIEAGTSLQSILMDMLSQRLQPSITSNPSISVTLTNAGAKEVGTIFSPAYTTSFNDGAYTYEATTGSKLDGDYTVSTSGYATTRANDGSFTDNKDQKEESNTGASGSFTTFVVDEDTNYKLSASAKHTAGNVAKDNLGDPSNPEIKIAAGTKTANSSAVTGYRAKFFGWYNSKALDPAALTSDDIRKLAITGTIGATERPLTALPSGEKSLTTNKMQQMFFAAVKGTYTSVAVANSTNGAPQTVKGPVNVKVEGANGFTAVDYDVFYIDNDGAESGSTTFNITIA